LGILTHIREGSGEPFGSPEEENSPELVEGRQKPRVSGERARSEAKAERQYEVLEEGERLTVVIPLCRYFGKDNLIFRL